MSQMTPRKKQWLNPMPYPANVPKQKDLTWEPCPICWAQGFIISQDPESGAAVRVPCSTCMGIGQVTRV
jgi:hypothetical protein